ncbi:MAG: hypothetical protein JKY12_09890 [Sneathiella sp.]|nr:hypothetical protein [Sneathiella sp.]
MSNLIRVQKWKLDEKRRAITDMENLLAGFKDQLAKLDRDKLEEQKIVTENIDTRFAYSNYLQITKQRRENLIASVVDAEERIADAQEEVAGIFEELKKYEISEDMRIRRLKELQDKRLQEEMDAVSIEMHRRKTV